MITQAVVAPLPANVISASNGFLFGAFWGTLLSWATTLVGASLCYYISKTFGRPLAMRFADRGLFPPAIVPGAACVPYTHSF